MVLSTTGPIHPIATKEDMDMRFNLSRPAHRIINNNIIIVYLKQLRNKSSFIRIKSYDHNGFLSTPKHYIFSLTGINSQDNIRPAHISPDHLHLDCPHIIDHH
ncbi:hypothetical protein VPNG_01639 [Cytospora leucostoma]|uniref:Uncharacterized protein n=1 Tax=Cytospora leucostoma TaxID=1230097 RepID=A0A423XK24_9PEZI|nr:hypothetical protein VPNG_01639 [Cytospora leucostoma]